MARAVRLSKNRARLLRTRLDDLSAAFSPGIDPVDFVHRYTELEDQEVAALFAASLAFGRVASFAPVLERIFSLADAAGGPARWVDNNLQQPDTELNALFYRWVRGHDLIRFARAIGRFRHQHGTVKAWIDNRELQSDSDIKTVLGDLIDEFRDCSIDSADESFQSLSRGYKHLLPHPSSGSACKRWCMLLRWMSRSTKPDLGLWAINPQSLVIPLDTHVHRVARMVGLTRRTDGSWRTAAEVTANLRRIDPDDPVRFDFVLAHLGIDGQCKGKRVASICNACSLVPVCNTGQSG